VPATRVSTALEQFGLEDDPRMTFLRIQVDEAEPVELVALFKEGTQGGSAGLHLIAEVVQVLLQWGCLG